MVPCPNAGARPAARTAARWAGRRSPRTAILRPTGDCSTDSFCCPSVLNLNAGDWAPAGLWLAIVASGLYHGVNPGMGWPLVVSAGLMKRSSRALMAALWPLAAGHLLGMLVVMLPFAFLDALIKWQRFDPEWRQPPGDRVRYLAARQPPPSAGAGANTTDAVRTLVLHRGNCSWGVADRDRLLVPRKWNAGGESRQQNRDRSSWRLFPFHSMGSQNMPVELICSPAASLVTSCIDALSGAPQRVPYLRRAHTA